MNIFQFNFEIDFEHIVIEEKLKFVTEVTIDEKANFKPFGLAHFPNLIKLILGSTHHGFMDMRRN